MLNKLRYQMALVYLDDISVFFRVFKESFHHLRQVLSVLGTVSLQFKGSDAFFSCADSRETWTYGFPVGNLS